MHTLALAFVLLTPQGDSPTPRSDDSAPRSDDAEILESFAMLRSTQKAMLIARVRNHLLQTSPAMQRIHALAVDPYELPEVEPIPIFDPRKTARGKAPDRKVIEPDAKAHQRVRAKFSRTQLLGDLQTHVVYDWCRGRLAAKEVPLDYERTFTNMLNGYPPGTDHAVARIMAELDDDEAMRGIAHWFGHTYADLKAKAYRDVTLYDAWYSGEVVMVPDVDAIPFAHDVLGRTEMQSPLSGRPRDELYEAIKQSALLYRKYRSLREAAAAAFVRADPKMDEMYARLVPRFHVLYPECDDSLEKLNKLLKKRDRDSLLADVDRRVKDRESKAWGLRLAREKELKDLAASTRATAIAQLKVFTRGR